MKISGIPIAQKILESLKREIDQRNLHPYLAIIFAGNHPNSQTYIRFKQKAAQDKLKLGIFYIGLPETIFTRTPAPSNFR